jgi:hypothetical protein
VEWVFGVHAFGYDVARTLVVEVVVLAWIVGEAAWVVLLTGSALVDVVEWVDLVDCEDFLRSTLIQVKLKLHFWQKCNTFPS